MRRGSRNSLPFHQTTLKRQLPEHLRQQPTDEVPTDEERKWFTCISLFTIMGAIYLVCSLMVLDTSIIATVKATAIQRMRCLTY